jgi:hypothetical protein
MQHAAPSTGHLNLLTSTNNRALQQAESAFAKLQTQFITRKHQGDRHDVAATARAANTMRLKAAREERDLRTAVLKSISSA